ncbi:hypothetical protein KK137_11600 [Croceibacterium sp. LX-88]|uniref:DUF4198 domain-containing protein n=1 Tax=Croceibacterium selenioxidans TaxID=2838833 RepID=A0ABS5W9A1_9SPHN|nr:DUF6152 family protein [Croceibacterium selenioxidans]MBT2134979.1 hypothetical protein [Croceibacterium selenioxidans]
MTRTRLLPLAALLLGPLAIPAAAHHSYAMFDMQKTVVLDASVVRFKWQNPHAFIEADVATKAGTERWAIEMTSPNNLAQEGWKRTSLKPGDKVKIWVHPLRSGDRGGSYAGVKLPDGSTLGTVS